MKQHLNLKNHKVLLVLFSLLFVTSIVQTAAILDSQNDEIEQNQTAQVLTTRSCVSISHNYNQILSNPFLMVYDTGVPFSNDYGYTMNVNVTNNCTQPVSIIDPQSLDTINTKLQTSTVSYFGIDRFASNGPEAISPLPNNPEGVDPVLEWGICTNCGQGSAVYRFSPLGTDVSQGQTALRVYSLAVGQTRNFDFGVDINVPHSTEDPGWLRAQLLRIKWFYNSAYTDSLVTGTEVKTLSLTEAQQVNFATDWTVISQDGNGSLMCPVDENPVFNNMYEPRCQ